MRSARNSWAAVLVVAALALAPVACVTEIQQVVAPADSGAGDGQATLADSSPPPISTTNTDAAPDDAAARVDANDAAADADADADAPSERSYYMACLSELGLGNPRLVFNFWVNARVSPGALTLGVQPLQVVNSSPPPKVSRAGLVGAEVTGTATRAADGRFLMGAGTLTIPPAANPISGSEVVIELAQLDGRWAATASCARLHGNLTKPAAAARTLDPAKNVCRIVPIEDGQTTPSFTTDDFAAESCPP